MSVNHYSNFLDPKMTNSIGAILNILGFQEMMNNDHEGKILSKLHLTLQFVKSIATPGNIDHVEAWSIKILNHHIVFGQPIKSDGHIELISAFFRLAFYQLQMALDGFFIRGGLGIGPHFMDDEIIYGPTLLDTYILESKQAVEPRIVLHKSARDLVQNHLASSEKPAQTLHNFFLLLDNDNNYFLNYLAASLVKYGEKNIAHKLVAIHKKQVIEKLKLYRNNQKIWHKYIWVANYHNYFCNIHQNLSAFKIEEKNLNSEPHKIF